MSKQQEALSIKEVVHSMLEWYQYLLSKWVYLIAAGLIGGLVGLTYSLLSKPVYTAASTFVLEEEAQSGLGAYTGVASALGIDLGGMGGGNNVLFKGDNIFELYRSRRMIEKTLLTHVSFNNGKKEPLIERYLKYTDRRTNWADKPDLKNIRFDIPYNQFTSTHDSIISQVFEEISKDQLGVERPDKKISVIRVSMESGDPLFAKEFTELIVKNVSEFYIQTKSKRSNTNVKVLQRQADSVKNLLNNAISGTASARQANPNANSVLPTLDVNSQKKQVDIQASSAVYIEILKNLEIGKVTQRRETPLIQEIDHPVLPLKKKKPGKLISLIGFGFGFGFMMVLWLVVRRIWTNEISASKQA